MPTIDTLASGIKTIEYPPVFMIDYRIALLSLSQQTLKVTVSVPALADQIHISLPAWIPGSYMIRDFARNIGEFSAKSTSGEQLAWRKTDKQSWTIDTANQACELSYTVVANDFSVRGAYINDDYCFVNGTSVFVDIKEADSLARRVHLDSASAPAQWQGYTAMPEKLSAHSFGCESYQALIDLPIYWGIAQVETFVVNDVEFSFLLSGRQPIDITRITQDLIPICQHHFELFNAPSPISQYLFITLLADNGFGGLEHRDSTVLMYPRFDLPVKGEQAKPSDGYINFLSLCSHEFFHTWHVKRLRPEVMLNPDLSKEVYTEQLWIYEGITSFYDDLAVARAGKMSPEHYLTILGRHLTRLLHTPGKDKQSPAESSFDAWTRFYKQDANSNNQIVSYYTKGGIIALGLDLLLRQSSEQQINLDTVMATMWQRYGINETGTPDNVIETLCADLGVDVTGYLNDVAYGTDDVGLAALLCSIGLSLQVRNRQNTADKGGVDCDAALHNDFGALLKAEGTGCKVTQVQQGSAAEAASLMIGDIIIAADKWVVNEALLMRLVQSAEIGSALSLSVIRQGRLLELSLPIQAAQQKVAYISIDDRTAYLRWLGVTDSE